MNKEIRAFNFEVRAERDETNGSHLTGQPIVYNERTDLGWYDEIIEDGALNDTDLRDVRFLVNHNTDMIPLARSRNNFIRHPIAWELWQIIKQTPINYIDYKNYTVINDYTCDIDWEDQQNQWG